MQFIQKLWINFHFNVFLLQFHFTESHYVIHRIRTGKFMNVMKSGSPLKKISAATKTRNILWDVITYAFERRSSKKMWVRAFLYAAIWSLEDGPGSLLVNFTNTTTAFVEKPMILQKFLYTVVFYAHRTERRSFFTTTVEIRKIMQRKTRESVKRKLFLTHSHRFQGENLAKLCADDERLWCRREKYFQFLLYDDGSLHENFINLFYRHCN